MFPFTQPLDVAVVGEDRLPAMADDREEGAAGGWVCSREWWNRCGCSTLPDYITKPFDHREVLARVSAHLQQQRLFGRMAEQVESSRQGRAPGAESEGVVAAGADEAGLRLVYRAIDILLDEMADPPGLTELAHRVGTNHVRLGRAFRTHLGMSAFEYLREQRLVRAQEMLATTDRQIRQIADAIGFKRAGDFATAFKLRFGMTPREYRKNWHG